MEYAKPERIWLKQHPKLNEKWLQDRIADDPSILGLGDLILKDRERSQPRAGRLDLLLQDPDAARRFEVEIQLGRTDEAHIIRTIEYWDIERKRYPQYEHVAVIVAEDITSRFLNVIGLFNGFIPLVAIQLAALSVKGSISLVATTVLDQLQLGLVDEDEEVEEVTDRAYWEERGSKATVAMADAMLEIIHEFAPEFSLKYNKFYIGLARDGQAQNFVLWRPQKHAIRAEFKLARSEEVEKRLEAAGLDVLEYSTRGQRYKIRLAKGQVKEHEALLRDLFRASWEASRG
jgi:hypothetical protein